MSAAQVAGLTRASTSVASSLNSFAGSEKDGEAQSHGGSVSHGVNCESLNGSVVSASRSLTRAHIHEIVTSANALTYVAIITAMMGALMFGIDQGNYGLASEFPGFYDEWCKGRYDDATFHCVPGQKDQHGDPMPAPAGWVSFQSMGGSLITIGAAAGCLLVGPLISSNCGRRPCISLGGLVCFGGCLLASYFTFHSVPIFYCGRFVTGFGVGISCFALPLYNSEIATPPIRGLMGSMFQLMVVVGTLLAVVILAFDVGWKFGMLLPGIAGAVVSVFIWFTPESPRFVMEKKGEAVARGVLQKVRRGDPEEELQAMKHECDIEAEHGQVTYGELFRKPLLRKRLLIACYLQIAQQLTGVNAFLSYTTKVFEGVGFTEKEVTGLPGLAIYFNLCMLLGCIAGLILIDSRYGGRRVQLVFATVFMGPALILAGVATLSRWTGWISVGALFVYGPGFQLAWGIVPWIYPSEIFAMNEKDKACSIATFFVFAVNFVVNVITPHLMNWSPGGTFLFFGALNVSNFFFVVLCIRETKGVPLEDVPALFTSGRREVRNAAA